MPTTWSNIDDSQGASWDNVKSFGFLLLETGVDNFLIQETTPAPFNKFIINSPISPQTWIPVNVST